MKHAQDELVWIDPNGVVHPLGEAATQRMRQREGAYRMFNGPTHAVFMRYTGEDGRRDAEDGAIVRMVGEITSPGFMCEILAMIGELGWKGELFATDGEHNRSIFFDRGDILGAVTNVEQERLGRVLLKYGAITEQQLERVVERTEQGERFAASAVDLGFVSQDEAYRYLLKQAEEIVLGVLLLADGAYFFLDNFDEHRLPSRQVVHATSLLMNCVARMDEMKYFRPRIPSSYYIPQSLMEIPQPPEEFAEIWPFIDGKTNIEEIGQQTQKGEFAVTKEIFKLLQIQLIRLLPPRMGGGTAELIHMANVALRLIHHEVDEIGRGTIFRTSLVNFAKDTHVALFHNAGPFEDGTFDEQKLLQNAIRLAEATDLETYLKEMLYDYVSFALFCVGSALGSKREQALSQELGPILEKLRSPMNSWSSSDALSSLSGLLTQT